MNLQTNILKVMNKSRPQRKFLRYFLCRMGPLFTHTPHVREMCAHAIPSIAAGKFGL